MTFIRVSVTRGVTILGVDCGVKIAFDQKEGKCFILYSEEGCADRLEHLTIDVNREEIVSFFGYKAFVLYKGHEDEGCAFQFCCITCAWP
jgi:hypothetical protein